MGNARAYLELARRGYRRHATYTTAAVAGVFTTVVFGVLRVAVMAGVYAGTSQIGGYDFVQAVTYVWLVQGLMTVVRMYGAADLAMRIRSGDITVDLLRPIDLQLSYLATDYGRAAYAVLFRGVPPVLVGALFYEIVVPAGALMWLAFAASVALAVAVSCLFRFLYNLSAFWLMDFRGIALIAVIVVNLLSGFVIPVAFFPDWLARLASLTPFPSMVQTPVDLFTGHVSGAAALSALGTQLVWVALLYVACQVVLRRGRHLLVVQGG